MAQNTGALIQKHFEVSGVVCNIPSGIQHDLGEMQQALDNIDKFGSIASLGTGGDPATLWTPGGLHPGIQAAAAGTIESSDANDAAGGTGAQTVLVTKFNQGYVESQVEYSMDGTTPVSVGSIRGGYRIEVVTQGSSGPNVGTLSLKVGSTIVASVLPGAGQTRMAWYVVPVNTTGYLLRWYVRIGRQTAAWADCSLRVRKWALGGARNAGVAKRQDIASIGGPIDEKRPVAMVIPGRSAIWVNIDEVSATLQISGGFDMLTLTNIGI